MKIKKVSLRLPFSILGVMSLYYIFYFLGFSEKEGSDAGLPILLLKIVSVAAFILLYFDWRSIFQKKRAVQYILLIVVLWGLIFLVTKSLYLGQPDLKYFNLLLTLLPFCLLANRNQEVEVYTLLNSLVFVVSIQILIDIYIFINGFSLWENNAFIGGVGNANAFGFICNICLSYLLYYKQKSFHRYVLIVLISFGILFTVSMMSVLFMLLNFTLYFTRKNLLLTIIVLLTSIAVLFSTYELLLPEHLKFKFESLLALLSGDTATGSRSVSLRVEIYNTFFENIERATIHVIFFGYENIAYYIADSQYLTYIGSFGLLWSVCFFSLIFYYLYISIVKNKSFFWTVVFIQFVLFFFVNRALDYFPIGLILGLAISSGWHESKYDDSKVSLKT
ncbi:hypothetical protein [Kangiella geojedonensis]|uniref:O-antigen polymerase n=1 Tax=Kangiella geojedonensis TaxID=914150 RepID=A0A0F6TQS6_9GAMM|nr:hypothetical protein [Kangiella geojedonensis]AKE52345.1 hypothetical protein TQ33_1396 [Kangiella geojedonensis]